MLEREDVRIAFSLRPLASGGEVKAGADAWASFTLTDPRTGEPLAGQRPLAWMTPRAGEQAPDEKGCKTLVSEFLGGLLSRKADVDMNGYMAVTLNEDNTLSVINPQLAFSRTKLFSLISLTGAPADWVLHPSKESLFLSLPGANRVAVVDTVRFRLRGTVPVGKGPTRLALSPDGGLLAVGNDGEGSVSLLDAKSQEVLRTLPVGPGPQELVFAEEGRMLWVSGRGGEVLSGVDVDRLEVVERLEVGQGVTSLAVSDSARAVYAAIPSRGEVVVVDSAGRKVAQRISLGEGVERVALDPSGRWLFALHRDTGKVSVVDTATGQPRHVFEGLVSPDFVTFTPQFAYVRDAGDKRLLLIQRESLAKPGEPVTLRIPFAQTLPGKGDEAEGAAPVVPTPDGQGVLIASPEDRALFFFQEGMMAPSGSHLNYGRRPRAVMVVDRSLSEVKPGVYASAVKPSQEGVYEVPLLLDSPRRAVCFEYRVAPGATAQARVPKVEFTALFDADKRLHAAQTTRLHFRLVNASTKRPLRPQEVSVLLFKPPGAWQRVVEPQAVEDGGLEVSFTPPSPGQYQMLVGTRTPASPLGKLPPLTLRVGPAEGPPPASLHVQETPP
ncbi:hypothetical protein DB31_2037 [Hyalangium minutum]|uniref:Collagen triple helix repeat domain protein n=1 Tax=Hyalangium minutum TaxID=394096 RepID=A0A085W980_9BACT|nr:hypothetical protein DB31_2037 [Hyalangium minutum]